MTIPRAGETPTPPEIDWFCGVGILPAQGKSPEAKRVLTASTLSLCLADKIFIKVS
ncbi:hypothetical protein [Microseira sp. BLCC-F43]|uniref:hypothetical protein n=1 Tax=Microseira sp. BLCC-F43 TaxID=3153602 RepID=UPI0035B87BF6